MLENRLSRYFSAQRIWHFPQAQAKHNVEPKKATATTNTGGLYDARLLFWT